MNIIAIDPGTFEVGVYREGQAHTLYLYDRTLSVARQKRTTRPYRLSSLATQLQPLLYNLDFLVYEEQFVRGGAATKALFGAVGVIEAIAECAGLGVMSVPQSTTRKWVKEQCENAKLTPSDIKDPKAWTRLYAHMQGLELATEHEYDAYCLYEYVKEMTTKGLR